MLPYSKLTVQKWPETFDFFPEEDKSSPNLVAMQFR